MPYPDLSDTLHRLMHAYKMQLRATALRHQISLPVSHIRALKGICRLEGSTARSIALAMNRDKAQITRVLSGLMESGLIAKASNPDDRRSQLLIPTKSGKQLVQTLIAIEAEVAARLTRTLSAKEVDEFRRLGNIMIDNAITPEHHISE